MTGQNGSGDNGTEKMVWTKWYNFVYILIQLNSI